MINAHSLKSERTKNGLMIELSSDSVGDSVGVCSIFLSANKSSAHTIRQPSETVETLGPIGNSYTFLITDVY